MIQFANTLCICFSVVKLRNRPDYSHDYGGESWEIFWSAISPATLAGAQLFHGDIPGQDVFCIAIQHADSHLLKQIEEQLIKNKVFQAIKSTPDLLRDRDASGLPLPRVGEVECSGTVSGGASAESANAALKRSRQRTEKIRFNCQQCGNSVSVGLQHVGKQGKCPRCGTIAIIPVSSEAGHPKPLTRPVTSLPSKEVSISTKQEMLSIPPPTPRTTSIPKCSSVAEVNAFLKDRFSIGSFIVLSAVELYYVVQAFEEIIELRWKESAFSLSNGAKVDYAGVNVYDKTVGGEVVYFLGLLVFPSESDAQYYCNDYHYSNSAKAASDIGLNGRTAYGFSGVAAESEFSASSGRAYEGGQHIANAAALWSMINDRCSRFKIRPRIAGQEQHGAGKRERRQKSSDEVSSKRSWWKFWG